MADSAISQVITLSVASGCKFPYSFPNIPLIVNAYTTNWLKGYIQFSATDGACDSTSEDLTPGLHETVITGEVHHKTQGFVIKFPAWPFFMMQPLTPA